MASLRRGDSIGNSLENQAFSTLYSRLQTGISAGIVDVVAEVFSQGLITPSVKREVESTSLKTHERVSILLDAVQAKIKNVPDSYDKFAGVLDTVNSLEYLAAQMRDEKERLKSKAQLRKKQILRAPRNPRNNVDFSRSNSTGNWISTTIDRTMQPKRASVPSATNPVLPLRLAIRPRDGEVADTTNRHTTIELPLIGTTLTIEPSTQRDTSETQQATVTNGDVSNSPLEDGDDPQPSTDHNSTNTDNPASESVVYSAAELQQIKQKYFRRGVFCVVTVPLLLAMAAAGIALITYGIQILNGDYSCEEMLDGRFGGSFMLIFGCSLGLASISGAFGHPYFYGRLFGRWQKQKLRILFYTGGSIGVFSLIVIIILLGYSIPVAVVYYPLLGTSMELPATCHTHLRSIQGVLLFLHIIFALGLLSLCVAGFLCFKCIRRNCRYRSIL